jgi:hypothetical protein
MYRDSPVIVTMKVLQQAGFLTEDIDIAGNHLEGCNAPVTSHQRRGQFSLG